jgi:hypothetical protein
VTVNGFKYCKHLNGSSFDSFAHIFTFGGSLYERNISLSNFTALVDTTAIQLYDNITQDSPELEPLVIFLALNFSQSIILHDNI